MADDYRGPVVDVDLHHQWRTSDEVLAYLPKRWRDYNRGVIPRGPSPGAVNANVPAGAQRRDSYPEDGSPTGSVYELVREHVLDRYNIWRAVATFNNGMHAHMPNPEYAVALARAAHDWNADTWLTWDDRLYGVISPAYGDPHEAVKEIQRIASQPKIAAVLLAGNPLGVPYGHPIYHPVYAAAAEVGLPIDIHPGVTPFDRPTSGMWINNIGAIPLLANDAMHHITSFIVHGVFEKYPSLKILVKEHGTSFLPIIAWRLDKNYEVLKAESDWVRKWPSEYLRDHVKLGTQPLEVSPDPEAAYGLFDAIEGADEMFCFATDYPHLSSDDPNYVARHVPEGWARKVMCDNACAHYGWTAPAADAIFEQPLVAAAA